MYRYHVAVLMLLLIGCAAQGATAETLDITLNVPKRGNVALHLERHDAFAPGSQIQVMTPAGPVSVDPSTVKVFRGSMPNEPKSIVVLAVSRAGIVGSIDAVTERFDVRRGPLASSPLQVTRNEVQPQPCGVTEEKISPQLMRMMHESPVEDVQDAETLELQLAVEADNQFFKSNESNRDKALAYIAQVIGVTSAIYERDFNTRIVTSNVRLWEDENDPYPDDQSVFSLLDVFMAHYESEMTSVQRDMAVFMTMRGRQGGLARSIGGVCEPGLSYCAGDLAGDLDQAPNAYSWDQVLFAHEIGHVCGATHTQNCLWPGGPLDSCVTSEGGTCVRDYQTRAIKGTIMSYCHQRRVDGGGVIAEFHPRHKHIVRAYLERATCVGARAATRNNTLRGRLINSSNNTGIANAELHIRVYGNVVFQAPPSLGPDTVRTTSADGSFEFIGLSDGIYTIITPTEWALSPITIDATDATEQGISILVTDQLVQRDIHVVRGRPVTMKLQTNGDATDITFIIVSENIVGLVEALAVPGLAAVLGVPFTRTVPIGSYTIVPHAPGRRFTPSRIDVDVTESAPIPDLLFVSASTAPDTTSPLVAISTLNTSGNITLVEGDIITATSIFGGDLLTRTVGKNGVAVFENTPSDEYFVVECAIDTSTFTPSSPSTTYAGGSSPYPAMFEKRLRQMPLVARPYQLEITNKPYIALVGAELIIPAAGIAPNTPKPKYLPFEVAFGPTRATKVFVYPSGDLVFGNTAFNTYMPPLSSYDQAAFVVSTFSSPFRSDSSALDETGVWWKISGEAPNRLISVEWRKLKSHNCDFLGNCVSSGSYNFQVHIEEKTGVITMSYGVINPEEAMVPVNVGLRGADKLDARVVRPSSDDMVTWTAPEMATISDDTYNMYVDNTSVPQSGLQYRWFNAAVGVASEESPSFVLISPLPATDELFVTGLPQGARVRLIDVMGRTVLSAADVSQSLRWNVGTIPSGRYSVLVETTAGTTVQPVLITR